MKEEIKEDNNYYYITKKTIFGEVVYSARKESEFPRGYWKWMKKNSFVGAYKSFLLDELLKRWFVEKSSLNQFK